MAHRSERSSTHWEQERVDHFADDSQFFPDGSHILSSSCFDCSFVHDALFAHESTIRNGLIPERKPSFEMSFPSKPINKISDVYRYHGSY